MAESIELKVPDLGDFDDIPVIEVLVKAGDRVEEGDSLVTLESDKATMEVPASASGTIAEVKVNVDDTVSEGSVVALLEADATSGGSEKPDAGEKKSSRSSEENNGKPEKSEDDSGAESEPESKPKSKTGKSSAPGPEATRESGNKADVSCQLLVLGAGPGGYSAAFRAADLGQDTVLVERYPTLGGVCLNVGCIPSKALLHAAEVIEEAAGLGLHGVKFGDPKLNLDKLRSFKEQTVKKLTDGLAGLAKKRKVQVLQGKGQFISPHELEVEGADGKKLVRFENAIIAAGSEAVHLPMFDWDDERVMDSTRALKLEEIPAHLLVVGGGVIGLEMATVYRALGAAVTVVEFMDQLMPGADKDLVKPLAKWLDSHGVEVHLKTKVTEAKSQKNGIVCEFEGEGQPSRKTFDRVLVAVGRSANGKRIGAEKAGVDVSERGFIDVDTQLRTNVQHIFAIGDLIGQPMLAHKSVHQGHVAAEAAAGEKTHFDARVIPSVAFTDPEVAWIGVTETEAKKDKLDVQVAKFPWAASGRALGMGRPDGLTKLICDKQTQRIVGGGIVGVHAGDLISEIALAIEMGAELGDVARTIHPHPTLGESVGMAAEAGLGTITDLYAPKK